MSFSQMKCHLRVIFCRKSQLVERGWGNAGIPGSEGGPSHRGGGPAAAREEAGGRAAARVWSPCVAVCRFLVRRGLVVAVWSVGWA